MSDFFIRSEHPEISEEERAFLAQGKVIHAIKSYRDRNVTEDSETGRHKFYNLYDSKCVMEYERERLPKESSPPWADVPEPWDQGLTAEERAKFPTLTVEEHLLVLNGQTVQAIHDYHLRFKDDKMSLNHARRVIEYDRTNLKDDRTPEQKAQALEATVRNVIRTQARNISRALGIQESDVFAQFVYEANRAYRQGD